MGRPKVFIEKFKGSEIYMLSHKNIKELILDKLDAKVIEIKEDSSGCDQYVWIITTSNPEHRKIVLKKPKNEEYFRIIREVIACKKFHELDILVPTLEYWDEEILIETYIEGTQLDKIDLDINAKNELFFELGKILRKIHNIQTEGFGMVKSKELIGGSSSVIDDSGFLRELRNLEQTKLFSSEDIQSIKTHYETSKKLVRGNKSVLLHADFADSNILITPDQEIALIDFADLSVGNPMQDFAYMYETYNDTKEFQALIEGYQDAEKEEIAFFTFCRFMWLIPLLWKNKKQLERFQKALVLFSSMWDSTKN
jgi:aminoglycoside phosphotransferase (APT) family kinase protein